MTAYPGYPARPEAPDYQQQQYQEQPSAYPPENYQSPGYAEDYGTPQEYHQQQRPSYESYSSEYTSALGDGPGQQSYGQYPQRRPVYGAPEQSMQGSVYPPYNATGSYSQENATSSYYSSPSGPGYNDSFGKQEPNTPASSAFSPSRPGYPEPGPDGEDKGVMGAIGGGVAGAYAGHKVHHGFMGALGGAFAGHKLEDAYKEHRKHSQPPSPAPAPVPAMAPIVPAPNPVHDAEPPPGMAGGFHMSSRSVQLDGDNNLTAECKKVDGQYHWSSLDLNDCLTNINGNFGWARGGNFKASARQIRLVEGGNVLEAELGDGRGGWRTSRIWLNEKIENRNGELRHLL